MLTVWSLLPIMIPAIVMLVVVLTNQNRSSKPETFENWDNGLAQKSGPLMNPYERTQNEH